VKRYAALIGELERVGDEVVEDLKQALTVGMIYEWKKGALEWE
jgi:hypothetical protein